MADKTGLKVITPKFRVAFAKVFEPEAFDGGDPTYSLVMLFPGGTDLSKLKTAAKMAKSNKWGTKAPEKLETPFKDGNEYDYSGYEDTIAVRAMSKYAPGVVGKNPNIPITDETEFYSGCWARASIQAFAYDYKGMKKGVSFALLNVQKLDDDESFSGKSKASDDFNDGISEKGEPSEFEEGDDDMGF